jgi:hypothetical protein
MINPDMIGAAALIHGYAALWGLGITRTRNQIVAEIPVSMNEIFTRVYLLKSLIRPEILFIIVFITV